MERHPFPDRRGDRASLRCDVRVRRLRRPFACETTLGGIQTGSYQTGSYQKKQICQWWQNRPQKYSGYRACAGMLRSEKHTTYNHCGFGGINRLGTTRFVLFQHAPVLSLSACVSSPPRSTCSWFEYQFQSYWHGTSSDVIT
jgi:hypothetical protein